jgi:hypothetical protein
LFLLVLLQLPQKCGVQVVARVIKMALAVVVGIQLARFRLPVALLTDYLLVKAVEQVQVALRLAAVVLLTLTVVAAVDIQAFLYLLLPKETPI